MPPSMTHLIGRERAPRVRVGGDEKAVFVLEQAGQAVLDFEVIDISIPSNNDGADLCPQRNVAHNRRQR